MESCKNEITENTKNEFKTWFKKYQEQLRLKNQLLKSRLETKQARNNELKIKINKLMETSTETSSIIVDAIPNKAQANIKASVDYLKTKTSQLNICNEAMEDKVKEETKRIRQKIYDTITNDKITLKPYHEVEEAIKELTHQKDTCLKKQNAENELYIQTLRNRAQDFLQMKQDISMLEPIEHEIELEVQKLNKNLEEKMRLLKVKTIAEACHESIEANKLLNDINNLKSQVQK